jgi:hypothetical protein
MQALLRDWEPPLQLFWAQHDAGLAYLGVPGYLKSRRSTAMLPLLAEHRKAGREFQSGRFDGSVAAPAKSDSNGCCNWLLVTALCTRKVLTARISARSTRVARRG